MGNLNKFYLMGRVARAPQPAGDGDARTVILAITPGTSTRNPRGGPAEALQLEASGAQADGAEALKVGQGVFIRGQLRQEAGALVAKVQAIELLAPPRKPRPPREGEAPPAAEGDGPGASKRRRRRGRGRGRGREGKPKPADLPPAEPVVQPPPEPVKPPPDPTLEQDMPF